MNDMTVIYTNGIKEKDYEMEYVPYAGHPAIPTMLNVIGKVIFNKNTYVICKDDEYSAYFIYQIMLNFHGEETRCITMQARFSISKYVNGDYRVLLDYVRTHQTYTAESRLRKWKWLIKQFADEIITREGL